MGIRPGLHGYQTRPASVSDQACMGIRPGLPTSALISITGCEIRARHGIKTDTSLAPSPRSSKPRRLAGYKAAVYTVSDPQPLIEGWDRDSACTNLSDIMLSS